MSLLVPRSLVLAAVAAVLASSLTSGARADDRRTPIETRLLDLVNDGRTGAGKAGLVMHGGLRDAARGHSSDMASAGRLSHDGYPERVGRARPDPAETNGPPDDGFTARGSASCENVAMYRPGAADDDGVARALYEAWRGSTPHRECMFDAKGWGLNVAGVGVAQDASGRWWATLEVVRDASPPRTAASPSATPAPTPVPTATPAPAPTLSPTTTPAATPRPAGGGRRVPPRNSRPPSVRSR